MLAIVAGLLTTLVPVPVYAATPRGLSISPVRQFITVDADNNKTADIIVGNTTDKPIDVSFSVKQFSVADNSYNFSFNELVGTSLVSVSSPDVRLEPGSSRSVAYTVHVPRGSTPGGRYYTILASATLPGNGGNVTEQVQAASLLYITVAGNLKRTNNIGAVTLPRFNFGSSIPFSLDVSNTGNIHYFMYVDAHLSGPTTTASRTSSTHLLLPIKTRHLESNLPSPVLPGMYKATIGYRTEFTAAVSRSSYIVYIPPWSIAMAVVVGYSIIILVRRHRRSKPHATSATQVSDDTTD